MELVRKVLWKFGLNGSDITTYLVLNNHGELDVTQITTLSKMSRTTVHDALNTLLKKKLVEQRKDGRHTYYTPVHPQQFKVLLAQQRHEQEILEQETDNLLEDLISTYNIAVRKPHIEIFPGVKGYLVGMRQFLEDGRPLYTIEDKGKITELLGDGVAQHIQQFVQRGIEKKMIAPDTNPNKTNAVEMRLTHFIDVNEFPFEINVFMNDKRVMISSVDEDQPMTVLITHPVISKNFRVLFDYLWGISKK